MIEEGNIIRGAEFICATFVGGVWDVAYQPQGAEEKIVADIIVAADGAWSTARNVLGRKERPVWQSMEQLAWRGRLPSTFQLSDIGI
jgi:2-polyprenyl-6-methoxyphenol hydroxylase-like FAD-dependent oxidoreductase